MDSTSCLICAKESLQRFADTQIYDIFLETIGIQFPGGHVCFMCRYRLLKLHQFRQLCAERCRKLQTQLQDCGYSELVIDKNVPNIAKTNTLEFSICYECIDNNFILPNNLPNEDIENYIGHIVSVKTHTSNETEFKSSPNPLDYESDRDILDNDNNDIELTNQPEITNKNNISGQFHNEFKSTQRENVETVYENEERIDNDTDSEVRFEKILLTLDEQKAELDAMRKNQKYLGAKFKCYSCALGFGFKDSYQSHMVRHEESNGKYSCAICTLRFAQLSVRSMHVALHAELHRCTRCSAVVRRARRRQHAARCGATAGAGCHECGEMFLDTIRLQQHIRRMHSTKANNKAYRCVICSKTFKDSSTLRVHMIKHSNERYHCQRCPSSFASPYSLNRHTRQHDSTAQEYCAPCDVWFKSRKTYRAHLKTATAHTTNSYECTICARACPTRRALDEHVQTHGEARYSCAVCPAVYTTHKCLLVHEKTHAGRREPVTVICHLCGKGYKGKNKLKRHLREVCEVKNTSGEGERYTLEQMGLDE